MQTWRLLLVEDHPEHALLLSRTVKDIPGECFNLIQLDNVVSAERALSAEKVDCLLLSLRMVEARGWDVFAGLRAVMEIPIVLLAPPNAEAQALDLLRKGVQGYLIYERITPESLAHCVASAIARHGVVQELRCAQRDLKSRTMRRERELGQANSRLQSEASERIRAEKALVESVAQYRFMADCMPQIVWAADRRGLVVYVNQGWTRYTGRTAEDAMQNGWIEAIHPDDIPQVRTLWRQSIESGADFADEYRMRAADGEYRWHIGRALPRKNDRGEIVEWIGAATDIDDRKRVEAHLQEAHDALNSRVAERTSQLADANASLEAEVADRRRAESEALRAREFAETANRLKSQFLANMSHEIRTPMNGIIGMTELLLETDLESQQREYLQLVHTSAESLLSLINPVLDFAKIEAGRIQLETEPFALREMLEHTLKALAVRAAQKGLELLLDFDEGIPSMVVGDSVRLRQIVTNLVGNAIKFTETGGVTTRLHPVLQNEALTAIRFEVIDTGIGIPEDKHQQIFEAFAQVDGSTTRRYGGTGLGLAIVSSLVRQMGGQISVRSTPGEGSTFEVLMPVKLDAEGRIAFDYPPPVEPMQYPGGATTGMPGFAARHQDAFAGVRILVVEGPAGIGDSVVEMLRALGTNPHVVASGADALEEIARAQAEDRPFRLVLTDATLTDLSQIEFAEAIASDKDVKIAPMVVMFPGKADKESGNAVSGTFGAVGGIASPVHWTPRQPWDASNPQPLRVLVAEDNPINQRVAQSILLKRGHSVVVASNGLEALEAVQREMFDLILMDIQMPEMDGLEATRMIRSLGDRRASIPIVALTAHAMKGDDEKCLAAGMNHYLSKPFHKQQLLEMVEGAAGVLSA